MKVNRLALANVVKHLIVWYLAIYLPLGIMCHARAYVNFVHHRASNIPFEIMTIYGNHPTGADTLYRSWFWPPWKLQAGYLRRVAYKLVRVTDQRQASVSLEYVGWGDSVESKKAAAQRYFGDQFFEGFIWSEGLPVSAKPQITLIGSRAVEWLGPLIEKWDPAEQRMVYSSVTVNSTLEYLYNAQNIWYLFAAGTSIDVNLQESPELAEIIEVAARQPGGFIAFPSGTFPQALMPENDPEIMAALDEMVAKAGLWQAGMQSRRLLLQSIRWIDFRHAGLVTLHDSFVPTVLWTFFLYLPTLPIRYLLFIPLTVLPHWLIAPLAYLYLLALLLLLWRCIHKERLATLIIVSLVNLFIMFICSSG